MSEGISSLEFAVILGLLFVFVFLPLILIKFDAMPDFISNINRGNCEKHCMETALDKNVDNSYDYSYAFCVKSICNDWS